MSLSYLKPSIYFSHEFQFILLQSIFTIHLMAVHLHQYLNQNVEQCFEIWVEFFILYIKEYFFEFLAEYFRILDGIIDQFFLSTNFQLIDFVLFHLKYLQLFIIFSTTALIKCDLRYFLQLSSAHLHMTFVQFYGLYLQLGLNLLESNEVMQILQSKQQLKLILHLQQLC